MKRALIIILAVAVFAAFGALSRSALLNREQPPTLRHKADSPTPVANIPEKQSTALPQLQETAKNTEPEIQPNFRYRPKGSAREEDKFYTINSEIIAPKRISAIDTSQIPFPHYHRAHFKYIARLYITQTGTVAHVEPLKLSPSGMLNEELASLIIGLKFEPAVEKATKRPINCLFELTIEFKLD